MAVGFLGWEASAVVDLQRNLGEAGSEEAMEADLSSKLQEADRQALR